MGKSGKAPKESFMQKLLAVFSGGSGGEREKKRLLKLLVKQLKSQRFRFYKPNGEEAQPALAKLVYQTYKLTNSARLLLQNATESGALKTIIIESFLNNEQREILEEISEQGIRSRAEQGNVQEIAENLKDQMVAYFSAFDSETVRRINAVYNCFLAFLNVINFDYYFFLKKFDSNLPEGDFLYKPRFEAIPGNYIIDDLKDFIECISNLDGNGQWEKLIDVLEQYKGQSVINRQGWQKNLKTLTVVKQSNILLLIARHIEKNPYLQIKSSIPDEKIVQPYLAKMKTQTELTIQKIQQEKRNTKKEKLAMAVFGTTAVSRLKYYTEKTNTQFSKKMIGGFTYVEPLNYLKAFLLDYVKKDVKEVVDILLIRGKWSMNTHSQQLSEPFHSLLELSLKIIELDESLAEDGEIGSRMKVFLASANRDQAGLSQLRKMIKQVNGSAKSIIQGSGTSLVSVGKQIKGAIEDYSSPHRELIINWKELDSGAGGAIKPMMAEVYKKIYYFIQLIQHFFS